MIIKFLMVEGKTILGVPWSAATVVHDVVPIPSAGKVRITMKSGKNIEIPLCDFQYLIELRTYGMKRVEYQLLNNPFREVKLSESEKREVQEGEIWALEDLIELERASAEAPSESYEIPAINAMAEKQIAGFPDRLHEASAASEKVDHNSEDNSQEEKDVDFK